MSHRTIYPKWMTIARATEAGQWATAPTRAMTICDAITDRDGGLPSLHVLTTWRYRVLARPLMRLIDLILGPSSPTLGRITQAGAMLIDKGPEDTFDRDDVVAEQQERIENLNRRNSQLDRDVRDLATRAHHAEDIGHAITRFARNLENDR